MKDILTEKTCKYFELTKPKVTLLNLLVGVTCFILAAYPTLDWLKLAAFSLVGYLAAGGCGVLNSVYDRDVDKLMIRTSKRAIPAGHITKNKALTFGIAMIAVSFVSSYYFFNPLTFLMLALGLVFYLLVYTIWLKRASPWNVVIGGFAGCFAALSGWTAAVNTISLVPLLVSTLDFLWTPGHLWGLAMKKMKEYKSSWNSYAASKSWIKKSSPDCFPAQCSHRGLLVSISPVWVNKRNLLVICCWSRRSFPFSKPQLAVFSFRNIWIQSLHSFNALSHIFDVRVNSG